MIFTGNLYNLKYQNRLSILYCLFSLALVALKINRLDWRYSNNYFIIYCYYLLLSKCIKFCMTQSLQNNTCSSTSRYNRGDIKHHSKTTTIIAQDYLLIYPSNISFKQLIICSWFVRFIDVYFYIVEQFSYHDFRTSF